MAKSSSDSQEFTVSPSVSREKWAAHARNKLGRGFALIVARERKSANFYKEGRPTEPCPFKVARSLIEKHVVVEAGTHFLGVRYVLSSTVPAPPPIIEDDDDDVDETRDEEDSGEMDSVLDELDELDDDDDEEDVDADEEGVSEDDKDTG